MPDIDVKGIGTLTFPDGMSDEDIEKAIKTHPEYEHARAKSTFKPAWPAPKFLTDWLGKPEDSPNPTTMARVGAKGVPIAGAFVPQDKSMSEMEDKWPVASALAKGSTGALATLPATTAMTGLTGTKFLANTLGQMGLGAGLSGADTAVKKGKDVTTGDILGSMGEGALWSGAGQAGAKLFSPGALPAKPTTPMPPEKLTPEIIRAQSRIATGVDKTSPHLDEFMAKKAAAAKEAAQRATQGKIQGATEAVRDNPWAAAGRAATMGIIGGHTGHPFLATALATLGAAAPHLPYVGAKYAHNTIAANPSTKDILAALLNSQYGNQ